MAVIEWGTAAAAARDEGMKLGSCPPYYIYVLRLVCVELIAEGHACSRRSWTLHKTTLDSLFSVWLRVSADDTDDCIIVIDSDDVYIV